MTNPHQMNRTVRIFEEPSELYEAAANGILEAAREATAARGRFLLVLAGGETPKPLYRLMSSEPIRTAFPWDATHVFWGDERAVPPDDEQSNYGMTDEYLLQNVPLPKENIHRIRGEDGASAAAREYARQLHDMSEKGLAWPRFDLVLLGLGSDGHTASLFPGSTHPSRSAQATLAVTGSYDLRPTSRITLTPPVFNSARKIFYLVSGERKANVVASVLEGDKSPVRYPALRIRPSHGSVTWFLDSAAARKLKEHPSNNRANLN